jgi:predicted nucleic acid-binding protein
MSEKYVLDACSLISLFSKEPGGEKVKDLLNSAADGQAYVMMNKVNVYEVHYDLSRRSQEDLGFEGLATLNALPIVYVDTISDFLIEVATHFKLTYKISVADSFALATAKIEAAKLVTSDHHEFDPIDKAGELSFLWIR